MSEELETAAESDVDKLNREMNRCILVGFGFVSLMFGISRSFGSKGKKLPPFVWYGFGVVHIRSSEKRVLPVPIPLLPLAQAVPALLQIRPI